MGTKSASNILHGILVQHPIGYEFDIRNLQEEAINYGYNFSEGALTGFIARALRKKIISVKGTIRPKDQKRTRRLYTLIDKQDWAFKPAGVGSYPGREIHGKARGDDQLELIEPKEETTLSERVRAYADEHGLSTVDMPVSDHSVDALMGLPKTPAGDIWPDTLEPKREFTPEELSLGEQLIAIAAKVELLENKPEKSLADYSTNDLIEELRKRIK